MLKAISTITNALGALNYKGTWNASSNTPTLADGTGAKGDYYVVSTAGTQTFGGVQLFFGTGDWIAYNGAVWQRVEGGSDGNFANVTLTSTDAGAAESPILDLYRDSATPAASDTLAEIAFNGEDSAGNKQKYGCIHGSILSPTSTSEAGQIHFETATAGASTEKMIIGTTNLVINDIGAIFNVRIEGDTDANLLYTDATNDRVGVGTVSPSVKFEVNGAAKASSLSLTTALPIASGGTNMTTAPPMFAAYSDSTQTPASATATKVIFGTESFDTNSNFASSRFTATIAGYYQFSACAACAADTSLTKVLLQFYKNGAAQIDIVATSLSSATSLSTDAPSAFSTSSLVYLAATDYVEVYATVTGTGGNRYIFASNAGYPTVFTGALIR
jgi:hypothetical protein